MPSAFWIRILAPWKIDIFFSSTVVSFLPFGLSNSCANRFFTWNCFVSVLSFIHFIRFRIEKSNTKNSFKTWNNFFFKFHSTLARRTGNVHVSIDAKGTKSTISYMKHYMNMNSERENILQMHRINRLLLFDLHFELYLKWIMCFNAHKSSQFWMCSMCAHGVFTILHHIPIFIHTKRECFAFFARTSDNTYEYRESRDGVFLWFVSFSFVPCLSFAVFI